MAVPAVDPSAPQPYAPLTARPLACAAAAFAVGVALGRLPWSPVALLGMGACLWAIAALRRSRPITFPAILLFVAAAGAGRLVGAERVGADDVAAIADGRRVTVHGAVCGDVDQTDGSFGCLLEARSVSDVGGAAQPCTGWLRVRLAGSAGRASPACGDGLAVTGLLEAHLEAGNPGGFDAVGYYDRHHVHATISAHRAAFWRVLPEPLTVRTVVLRMAYGWRRSLADHLAGALGGARAAVLTSLVFGGREAIDHQVQEDFAVSGLAHVLAASGANVALVTGPCLWLLRRLGIRRRYAAGLTLAVLALYVLAAGAAASVLRAAVIASLALGAPLLDRESDVSTSLGCASLVILTFDPGALFDAGFQLSFVAVIALAATWRPDRGGTGRTIWASVRAWSARAGVAMVAVQLAAAPLTAYHFGMISLAGILANVLAAPAVVGCVWSALAAWSVSLVWGSGGAWLARALVRPALAWLVGVAHGASRLPMAAVHVGSPSWLSLVLSLTLVGAVLGALRLASGARAWPRVRRRAASLGAAALVALVALISCSARPASNGSLEVTFLDVGQGDCALVRMPTGEVMVVDTGRTRSDDDSGRTAVIPYLRSQGISRIDLLCLTHADDDHTGGAASIIERVPVGMVALPAGYEERAETGALARALEAARERATPLQVLQRGQTLTFGDVSIQVLNPGPMGEGDDEGGGNSRSLVFRIVFGKTAMLLTGDADGAAETRMVDRDDNLRSDLLKVSHHGSVSATHPWFLDRVAPRLAVISVGAHNVYGHPHASVLKELRTRGITVMRTDEQGAIRAVSDGQTIEVAGHRSAEASP